MSHPNSRFVYSTTSLISLLECLLYISQLNLTLLIFYLIPGSLRDFPILVNRNSIFSSLFNKLCWENWINTDLKMKLDSILHHSQKLTQHGVKVYNIRPETIKLLKENTGRSSLMWIFATDFWM